MKFSHNENSQAERKLLFLLFKAAADDYSTIIELIDRGIDLSYQDSDGNTSLHIAVEMEHKDLIECLINFGIDTTIKNKSGLTPIDMTNNYEIQSFFRSINQSYNRQKQRSRENEYEYEYER